MALEEEGEEGEREKDGVKERERRKGKRGEERKEGKGEEGGGEVGEEEEEEEGPLHPAQTQQGFQLTPMICLGLSAFCPSLNTCCVPTSPQRTRMSTRSGPFPHCCLCSPVPS